MTPETYIKGALATFAHGEGAGHGGIDNMLAVAFVVRNRVNAGWHGGSWMQILENAHKVCGTQYDTRKSIDLRDLNFRQLLQQVDDLVAQLTIDRMTMGALYYGELNLITNPWFLENICRKPEDHQRVAQVGNVSFFR